MATVLAIIALIAASPALCGSSKPVVSEEARRHFIRAAAFQKEAKQSSDYEAALSEYEKALELAPRWPEALYNYTVALESAGRYPQAIEALKRYLTTKPRAADARKAQDRVYALEAKAEKAASPEALVAEAKKKEAKLLQELDGARFVYKDEYHYQGRHIHTSVSTLDISGDEVIQGGMITYMNGEGTSEPWKESARFPLKGREFVLPRQSACDGETGFSCDAHGSISEDGESITIRFLTYSSKCPRGDSVICDGETTWRTETRIYERRRRGE